MKFCIDGTFIKLWSRLCIKMQKLMFYSNKPNNTSKGKFASAIRFILIWGYTFAPN